MVRRLHPHEYSKFIDDPNEPDHNVPPEQENDLIASGRLVEISPANDHRQHLIAHKAVMLTPDFQLWPEPRKMVLQRHIAEHEQATQGMAAMLAGGQQAITSNRDQGSQDSADQLRGMRPAGTEAA